MQRQVVGVMTGTSIDGIDAALVDIEGARLEMRATLVRHVSRGLGALAEPLRYAAAQRPTTAGALARLATDFGRFHAEVIADLLAAHDTLPDLICAHGQTIFHRPPLSWQLIDPAPIAACFGVPVVTDLRGADLAAGGRGAPITPLADWILYRSPDERRAIVNLGGYCNVTTLPPADDLGSIGGFDACACNQVLDAVARHALGAPYDDEGRAAASGDPDPTAVASLRAILDDQHDAARSLGTGDEADTWVRARIDRLSPSDLAASAVEAIASRIAACVDDAGCDRAILAGGGCRNRALLVALERRLVARLDLSDAFGVPCPAREAVALAVLGALSADGIPITLPQVTGCTDPAPIAGVWTGRPDAVSEPRDGIATR